MNGKGMIGELLTLEEIERAEESYQANYGHKPFSLSTWNPSSYYYNTFLLNHTILPAQAGVEDIINYIYYYEMDPTLVCRCGEKVVGRKTGHIVITNSGTSSISLVSSVLSAKGLHRILIISPAYFAVFHNCLQKQITIKEVHMIRESGRYKLPRRKILDMLSNIDAIWMTSPVYNTGIYLDNEDVDFLIKEILPSVFVVADECFCKQGEELARRIPQDVNFIGIYEPMKQFLINGAKFSIISIPSGLADIFYHWSDVVCGCLALSTVQAIKFYLSEEADFLLSTLQNANENIRKETRFVISQFTGMSLDEDMNGHMMMCYIPELPADYLHTSEDFYQLQSATGVSIIPGTRFHFNPNNKFSFRINLSRYDPLHFAHALRRTLTYLTCARSLLGHPPLISQ